MPAPSQTSRAWCTGFTGMPSAWPRVPVDIHVVTRKRDVTLFEKRNRIGVVARDLSRDRPHLRASLPAADVEHDDVAGSNLHPGLPFPRFEIRACDGGSRLDPV